VNEVCVILHFSFCVENGQGCINNLSLPFGERNVINFYLFVENYFRYMCLEFLATDPEIPGSIPGTTRFSEK
jgi:hypothetical protein